MRYSHKPARSGILHRSVVSEVSADAQAQALTNLKPILNDQELELVRRGRNKAGRGPRRIKPAVYGLATGFETMVGWLFLNNPARLADLFDHLDQAGTNSSRHPDSL